MKYFSRNCGEMAPQDEESRKDSAGPCEPGAHSQVRRFCIQCLTSIANEKPVFLNSI